MANDCYGELGGAINHRASIPRRNRIIVCSAILAGYQDGRVKVLCRRLTGDGLGSVEPGGSPEPHTFRSRLLDGFFNPVAPFGSVNIGGDLMLYAELSEHSTFDRLQRVARDNPFPTGFHGQFVKPFSVCCELGHEMLRRGRHTPAGQIRRRDK